MSNVTCCQKAKLCIKGKRVSVFFLMPCQHQRLYHDKSISKFLFITHDIKRITFCGGCGCLKPHPNYLEGKKK